jgi:hypothetical protein
MPKLNTGFDDEADEVGATGGFGGFGGVTPVGLLVTPKLNFGFDASLVPPATRVLVLGCELLLVLLVDADGLRSCENEKKP